jgi:hypothetical protein
MPMYGAPRRHHRGRLPIVLLLVASLAVAAYLLVGRGGGSGSSDPKGFVASSQGLVDVAHGVLSDAQKVQRFLELHSFDNDTVAAIALMNTYASQLEAVAKQSSGSARQLAQSQVAAAQEVIDAVSQYRQAVVFNYNLSRANTAQQDLTAALDTVQQNIKTWNKA